MDDEVLYDVADGLATVTLHRPDRLNAATFDVGVQLRSAFAQIERDDEVRAVVFTGAGQAFCSGDDIDAAWRDPRMAEVLEQLSRVRPPMTPETAMLLGCSKPTI